MKMKLVDSALDADCATLTPIEEEWGWSGFGLLDADGEVVRLMRATPSQSGGPPTWGSHTVTWSPRWCKTHWGLGMGRAGQRIARKVRAVNRYRLRRVTRVRIEDETYPLDEVLFYAFQ